MTAQILEKQGKPEFAVLPYDEYQALLDELEELRDTRDFDRALARIAAGEEELVPAETVYRILDGEHPIRVWREHRGLTIRKLAHACGVSEAAVSQIETGKRAPSIKLLKQISRALEVDMDELAV